MPGIDVHQDQVGAVANPAIMQRRRVKAEQAIVVECVLRAEQDRRQHRPDVPAPVAMVAVGIMVDRRTIMRRTVEARTIAVMWRPWPIGAGTWRLDLRTAETWMWRLDLRTAQTGANRLNLRLARFARLNGLRAGRARHAILRDG